MQLLSSDYHVLFSKLQPPNKAGIGELALDPTMFGASTTLLNANHYDVYFAGMPVWNGKVIVNLSLCCRPKEFVCFQSKISNAGSPKAWG